MSKNKRKTKVTRKDLERLRSLKKEYEYLKNKDPVPEEVLIFYKDYRHNTKGTPKVDVGIDDGSEDMRRTIEQMRKKRAQRWRLISRIEGWIDDIEDPEMRTIIRMFYCDGMSQADIGAELGYSDNTIKSKIARFWGKQKAI